MRSWNPALRLLIWRRVPMGVGGQGEVHHDPRAPIEPLPQLQTNGGGQGQRKTDIKTWILSAGANGLNA